MTHFSSEPLRRAIRALRPDARLFLHDRIDSTNLEAVRRIESGHAEPGDVHLAREQTAGRGTGTRSWWSPPDSGLWFTGIEDAATLARPLAFLPALAAVEALQGLGYDAHIKWPNDVLIGAAKVGGCLIQVVTSPEGVSRAAIGLGINIHQTEFPEEVDGRPTSLKLASASEPPELATLFEALLAAWSRLLESRDLIAVFRQQTRMLECPLRARSGTTVVDFAARDVDPFGHLIVRLADGSEALWASGDRHRIIIDDEWASHGQ